MRVGLSVKLVWVYKVKRDGSLKSRLCVQSQDFAGGAMLRRILACQVGWHSIEAERGHSCQPTWQAKMRRGIAFSAKY